MNAATISTTGNEATAWHAIAADDVVRRLNTNTETGLDAEYKEGILSEELMVRGILPSRPEPRWFPGIHLYRKTFLHAKHLSIDDASALIGSSNLDIRSFPLNAEVMLMIYDSGVTALLAAEQKRYHANSRLLTLATWEQR